MLEGSELFDKLFEKYRDRREHRPDNPNDALEKPIIWELIGDVKNKHILDLGCGNGIFGIELLRAGCQTYVGLEASQKSAQAAQENLQETPSQIVHTRIEDWSYPPESFDLVTSRLVLHYVADLDDIFSKVYHTLKPKGRFVFSMVHPVISSCDRSRQEGGGRRDWIVDDYFLNGERQVYFMGEFVKQFHRTIEDIFKSMQEANFRIEQLRESRPRPEQFIDQKQYERRRRIPLMLFLSGIKT